MSVTKGKTPFSGIDCPSVALKTEDRLEKLHYTAQVNSEDDICLVMDDWGLKYQMRTALTAEVSAQDERYNATVFIPQTSKGPTDRWLAYVSEAQFDTGSLKVFQPTDDTRTKVRDTVMLMQSPTPVNDAFVVNCPTLGEEFIGDVEMRVYPEPISILNNITTLDGRGEVKLVALRSKPTLKPDTETQNPCYRVQGASDWFVYIPKVPDEDDSKSGGTK